MVVARPRTQAAQQWGTLPGGYVYAKEIGMAVVGGKPIDLMRAIVRDYSRVGDLVCDPCAGGATTLLAAVMEGRRAIGAEMDPATFDLAVERLRRGVQVGLPGVA
jgi:adenine specific DNA methylase Mod